MTTGANVPQFVFEGTLTFSSVANSASNWAEQTVTLPSGATFPSAAVGSGLIYMELPSLQANLAFCNLYTVSTTTFKVRFFNDTGGALTPTGTNAKLIMF